MKMNITKVKYTILITYTWATAEDIDVAMASVEEDSAEVATKVATATCKEGTLIEDTMEMVNIKKDSTKRSTISVRNQDIS